MDLPCLPLATCLLESCAGEAIATSADSCREAVAGTGEAAPQIDALTSGEPIRLAIGGLAGDATERLIRLLSSAGTLVNYAQMSGATSSPGDFFDIMRKNLTMRSFYRAAPRFAPKISELARDAASLVAEGGIRRHVWGLQAGRRDGRRRLRPKQETGHD